MANLSVTVFNPIFDNPQMPPQMWSAPVDTNLSAGTPVKFDPTTGSFKAMASTDSKFAFAGLLTRDTKAGYVGVAFRGLAYMDGIDGLDVADVVTLGAAGVMTDTQAGEVVARVVPLHKSGGTFDKMIEILSLPVTVSV